SECILGQGPVLRGKVVAMGRMSAPPRLRVTWGSSLGPGQTCCRPTERSAIKLPVTSILTASLTDTVVAPQAKGKSAQSASDAVALNALRKLEEAFRQPFAILDLEAGEVQRVG